MINNRHIEVWKFDNASVIEETVNEYCKSEDFIPISVSVAYNTRGDVWVVALVVESKGGNE